MAVVRGIKEKVHLPIYDSVKVKPEEQLRDAERSSTLKFFIDVQGKTKLETNLQSAGLLPHYNTFEARALRVVFSDLPPKFPDDPKAASDSPLEVAKTDGSHFKVDGSAGSAAGARTPRLRPCQSEDQGGPPSVHLRAGSMAHGPRACFEGTVAACATRTRRSSQDF